MTTFLALYDPQRAPREIAELEARGEPFTVVPLDYEIALWCKRAGIPHLDLMPYHEQVRRDAWIESIDEMAISWYQHPSLAFFTYRGHSLARAYEYGVTRYLWRIFYYTSLFRWTLDTYGNPDRLIIGALPAQVPETAAPLAQYEADAPVLVLASEAQTRGIPYERMGSRRTTKRQISILHPISRALLGVALRASNVIVRLCTTERSARVYTSEYWKNVSSFIGGLTDAEFAVMDRRDACAFLPYLFALRLRFYRPEQFLTRTISAVVRQVQHSYKIRWHALSERPPFAGRFVLAGMDAWPLIRPALEHIVAYDAGRLLRELEGFGALFDALRINLVLARASVSAQTHFYALAAAARLAGIPSLELQHGVEYLAPGAVFARKNAEYIAVYSEEERAALAANDFSPGKIFAIGSPRFDLYESRTVTPAKNAPLLCILPEIGIEGFTTYDLVRYLQAVEKALTQLPERSVICKLRPGSPRRTFYGAVISRALPAGRWRIAEHEPLHELFKMSFVTVSNLSSVVLESVLSGVPVILLETHEGDRHAASFAFESLLHSHTITRALDGEELAGHARSLSLADAYENRIAAMAEWRNRTYPADGASRRLQELIKRLGAQSSPRPLSGLHS